MKTLLKNARILKMDDTPLFMGDIIIEDSRIVYIGNESEKYGPFDIVRDCLGNVLMPGFKNAHTHSAMSFLRSKCDDSSLHDWLFKTVFPREECMKPEDVGELGKLSFLEYLTSGITACFDQYMNPTYLADAAREFGFRLVNQTIFPDEDQYNEIRRVYKDMNRGGDDLVTCFVGMHAEYTATPEKFEIIGKIIKEYKLPFFVHVSETKAEVDDCFKRRGMSPIEYFESLGFLDNGGAMYHCVWMTDKDIEIFKKHNVGVVINAGSNTKLASGIAPVKKYLDAGLLLGIGTDGPASNNCLDMFKEMSLITSMSKVTTGDPSAVPAYDVLKMATVNGAKIMRLDDCDILEVGKKADIIEIDLMRPNMQPLNNIVNNIVYSGSKENVKMTMIDGKILYSDGQFHLKEKISDIYAKCQEITERIEEDVKKLTNVQATR